MDAKKIEAPELERKVQNGDIMPYAKKSCKWCFGRGTYFVIKSGGKTRVEALCKCGLNRFLIANKNLLYQAPDTGMHWLKGRAPTPMLEKMGVDPEAASR